jgi:FtsP/CotA-like multicopper oxidase with cupredoxin domain
MAPFGLLAVGLLAAAVTMGYGRVMRWMPLSLLLAALTASAAPPPFANPPEIVSAGGVLHGTLRIAPAQVDIAGKVVTTTVYNGEYMPPVLRVRPGDTVRLVLDNAGSTDANIHYHGLGVTPKVPGDNVFLLVNPATTFQYDFLIPADHPQGLFWYHPHVHPGVNPAIAGGLSGGMIIGNVLAPFPELAGITERVMLLKDMKLKKGVPVQDPDPDGKTIRTINGIYQPLIEIQKGELQLWRIGNIGANIYYKLRLPKHTFQVLAQDGNLTTGLVETGTLIIPPAARYEVLVRGGKPGKYKLKAMPFNTGPQGDAYPAQVLAHVRVNKPAVTNPIPFPTTFPPVPDLRQAHIDTTRTIVFADADSDDPSTQFTINGQFYDHTRIDTTVTLGTTEEWTIQNTSKELHVFHIHQTDFQVTEIDGKSVPFTGYQDTVSLPFAKKKKGKRVPGEVKVIIPFTNPVIAGEFVYHCHIVQHADQGMMANIQVVPPGTPTTPGGPGHGAH